MYYRLLLQDIIWDNGHKELFSETSGFDDYNAVDVNYYIQEHQDHNRGKEGCGEKIISYEYSIIEDYDDDEDFDETEDIY